jgi:PadR family transcriptional regulator PadR
MQTQLKKGVLELCVLTLLLDGDYYGYQLTDKISKDLRVTSATLYIILRKLKDKGYVSTYLKESNEGPARKYYHLSAEGIDYQKDLRTEFDEFVMAVNNILGGENE